MSRFSQKILALTILLIALSLSSCGNSQSAVSTSVSATLTSVAPAATRVPSRTPTSRPTLTRWVPATRRPSPTPSPKITFKNICDFPDGTQFILVGYIHVPNAFMGQQYIDLAQTPGEKNALKMLDLHMSLDQGPNSMKTLQNWYSPSDLEVTTDDNKVVGEGDRVQVTGTISYHYEEEGKCYLWVDKIEAR